MYRFFCHLLAPDKVILPPPKAGVPSSPPVAATLAPLLDGSITEPKPSARCRLSQTPHPKYKLIQTNIYLRTLMHTLITLYLLCSLQIIDALALSPRLLSSAPEGVSSSQETSDFAAAKKKPFCWTGDKQGRKKKKKLKAVSSRLFTKCVCQRLELTDTIALRQLAVPTSDNNYLYIPILQSLSYLNTYVENNIISHVEYIKSIEISYATRLARYSLIANLSLECCRWQLARKISENLVEVSRYFGFIASSADSCSILRAPGGVLLVDLHLVELHGIHRRR